MKKIVAFALTIALAAGFMNMPVQAAELPVHDHAAGAEARYDMYSPYCPVEGCGQVGKYLYQVESIGGHFMVYRECSKHGLYHHFT